MNESVQAKTSRKRIFVKIAGKILTLVVSPVIATVVAQWIVKRWVESRLQSTQAAFAAQIQQVNVRLGTTQQNFVQVDFLGSRVTGTEQRLAKIETRINKTNTLQAAQRFQGNNNNGLSVQGVGNSATQNVSVQPHSLRDTPPGSMEVIAKITEGESIVRALGECRFTDGAVADLTRRANAWYAETNQLLSQWPRAQQVFLTRDPLLPMSANAGCDDVAYQLRRAVDQLVNSLRKALAAL